MQPFPANGKVHPNSCSAHVLGALRLVHDTRCNFIVHDSLFHLCLPLSHNSTSFQRFGIPTAFTQHYFLCTCIVACSTALGLVRQLALWLIHQLFQHFTVSSCHCVRSARTTHPLVHPHNLLSHASSPFSLTQCSFHWAPTHRLSSPDSPFHHASHHELDSLFS